MKISKFANNRYSSILGIFNITFSIAGYLPPVGSHYSGIVKLPYFGSQNIDIYQVDNKKSYLMLKGIVNQDGWIYYTQKKNYLTKEIYYSYKLDYLTQQTLLKYKCKLIDAKYIETQDICQVIIANYLIYKTKTINLKRNKN